MSERSADSSIRLVHVLDLPEVTSATRVPPSVSLAAFVEFCEARLAELDGRPDAEAARLAGKSRERFCL
jgi:hypothetical protein